MAVSSIPCHGLQIQPMQSHLGRFIRKAIFCKCSSQQNNISLSAEAAHMGGFLKSVEQAAHILAQAHVFHTPILWNGKGAGTKQHKYGSFAFTRRRSVYLHKPDVAPAIHAFVPLCSWMRHSELTHKWREESRREELRLDEKMQRKHLLLKGFKFTVMSMNFVSYVSSYISKKNIKM